MTLLLRPPGRGNWAPITIEVLRSRHSPLPLEVFVGQRWILAGREFRIAKVWA